MTVNHPLRPCRFDSYSHDLNYSLTMLPTDAADKASWPKNIGGKVVRVDLSTDKISEALLKKAVENIMIEWEN